jgi:hypothetical protein
LAGEQIFVFTTMPNLFWGPLNLLSIGTRGSFPRDKTFKYKADCFPPPGSVVNELINGTLLAFSPMFSWYGP